MASVVAKKLSGSSTTMSLEMDEMHEIGRKAWKSASRAAKHMSKHSKIVNPKLEKQIPRFEEQEILVGSLLGSGGFNCVYELKGVKLIQDLQNAEHGKKISSELQNQRRMHVAHHCYRDASASSRYAIKFLSKETIHDPDRFCTGAADLVVEAKFLASLDHPNIIKLRGMAAAGTSGFASCRPQGYFLLLDRLQGTLDEKMDEWKDMEQKIIGSAQRKLSDRCDKKLSLFMADRLKVALDVAAALKYLHDNNVIYRDLKPDNIGFDVRGDVKLFDFGLAKELDDTMKSGYCNEFYELSGNTGSLRYMAPEVALSECYNLSADVYSFGLLLWQICSLDLPYDGMSRTDHSAYVVKGNERPVLDPSWSNPLRTLIKQAWEPDPSVRPSMNAIYKILMREIISLRDGDDTGLVLRRRSSTCIINVDSEADSGRPSLQSDSRGSMRNNFQSVSVRKLACEPSIQKLSRELSARTIIRESSVRKLSREPSVRTTLRDSSVRNLSREPSVRTTLHEPSVRTTLHEPSVRTTLHEPSVRRLSRMPVVRSLSREGTIRSLSREPVQRSLSTRNAARSHLQRDEKGKTIQRASSSRGVFGVFSQSLRTSAS